MRQGENIVLKFFLLFFVAGKLMVYNYFSSRTRETLNLLMSAEGSTNTKKKKKGQPL